MDEKSTELEIKEERNKGRNVIHQYYKFSKEIKALGSEYTLGDFKALKTVFIVICVLFTLILLLVYAVPFIPFYSTDYEKIRIWAIVLISIVSVGLFIYSYNLSKCDYYEELRSKKADRHSRLVEYMIRYYLVHNKVLEAKDAIVDDNGLDKVIESLSDEKIAKADCEITIDFLINKVEKEWHSLEEKIRRSVLLTFAVALATSGMATIKEFASLLVWKYGFETSNEIDKTLVALIGNFTAFVVFIFLVYFIRSIKDTVDSSTSVKSRNMEYAYYSLKKIKELVKNASKGSSGDETKRESINQ